MVQQCLAKAPYDRMPPPLPLRLGHLHDPEEPLFRFWFHCKPNPPGSMYRDNYVYIVDFAPKGADWTTQIRFFAPL
jgi:hypothetical protein